MSLRFDPADPADLEPEDRLVEIVSIADLTEKQLRGGVFKSVAALERAATRYIDARNEDAKPFTWTADADTILSLMAKYRAAISRSGH